MKSLLLIPLFLLLQACSLLPPAEPDEALAVVGSAGQNWELEGRVAIRQGQRADSASINWSQQLHQYRIELSGPLGQGGARILGSENAVSLELSGDEHPYLGATPEAVMQQALGWYLPVSQALYWVQGRPDPEQPFTPLSDASGFHQLGWQIRLRQVTRLSPDLVLPRLLELSHGDLRLRLLIRQWRVAPP